MSATTSQLFFSGYLFVTTLLKPTKIVEVELLNLLSILFITLSSPFRAGKYYVSLAFHNVTKSFLQSIDSIISTTPPSWI